MRHKYYYDYLHYILILGCLKHYSDRVAGEFMTNVEESGHYDIHADEKQALIYLEWAYL